MITVWHERVIDLILPAMIIVSCVILIACGMDGEMKALLGLAAGWIFGVYKEKLRK